MGAMEERASNKAETIDINQARSNRIMYAFCPAPRAVLKALTEDPRFDFGKREFKLITYVLNHMLQAEGTLLPVPMVDAQICKALGLDASNGGKTIKDLIKQNILYRESDRLGVNLNPDTWQPEGVVKKTRKHGQKNHEDVVEKTMDHGQKNHEDVVEKTMDHGQKNHDDMVKKTSPTSPIAATDAGFEDPLDYSETIETNHEREGEDLSPPSGSQDGSSEISTGASWHSVVRETSRLLMSEGYLLAANSGAAIDPSKDPMALQRYEAVVNSFLRKAKDDGLDVDDVVYMREIMQPVIKVCPAKFRASFGQWKQQFNFCLKLCREGGGFVDMWAEEAKARQASRPDRGMAPVSDFSHVESGVRDSDWD